MGLARLPYRTASALKDIRAERSANSSRMNILSRLPTCTVILNASPGRESFYEKHRFRRMKTGGALFKDSASMKAWGFNK